MDKSRLEELKEKNKIFIKHKGWLENELLQDCLKNLKEVQIIESEREISDILDKMRKQFPVNRFRHIDGAYRLSRNKLEFSPNQKYYIVWDNSDVPIVRCLGTSILMCLDDVFAVAFDTYLIADSFTEIIHCDDLDVLWRYF